MRWVINTRIDGPLPVDVNTLVEINNIFFRVHDIQPGPITSITLDWISRDTIPDGADVFGLHWDHEEISAMVH